MLFLWYTCTCIKYTKMWCTCYAIPSCSDKNVAHLEVHQSLPQCSKITELHPMNFFLLCLLPMGSIWVRWSIKSRFPRYVVIWKLKKKITVIVSNIWWFHFSHILSDKLAKYMFCTCNYAVIYKEVTSALFQVSSRKYMFTKMYYMYMYYSNPGYTSTQKLL